MTPTLREIYDLGRKLFSSGKEEEKLSSVVSVPSITGAPVFVFNSEKLAKNYDEIELLFSNLPEECEQGMEFSALCAAIHHDSITQGECELIGAEIAMKLGFTLVAIGEALGFVEHFPKDGCITPIIKFKKAVEVS